MQINLSKLLQKIKKPILLFEFQSKKQKKPELMSYIGGTPYFEENKKTPICRLCKKPMMFVFQLYIPENNHNVLYSFFYCFECSQVNGNKGFEIVKSINPSLKKLTTNPNLKSDIPYAEFKFEPYWSIPDWESLHETYPDLALSISKEFKEDSWGMYEQEREGILGDLAFDSFSFYKGYPHFLNKPEFPKCDCCNQQMELWLQIDSYDDLGLVWDDFGCLHIFKCKNNNEHFKILIQ